MDERDTRVTLVEPEVIDGSRDAAALVAPFLRMRAAFLACYERARRGQPELAGEVVIEAAIDEGGLVTNTALANNTLGDEAAGCVVLRLRALRLGEGGAARVRFRVRFEPATAAP